VGRRDPEGELIARFVNVVDAVATSDQFAAPLVSCTMTSLPGTPHKRAA